MVDKNARQFEVLKTNVNQDSKSRSCEELKINILPRETLLPNSLVRTDESLIDKESAEDIVGTI